MATRSYAAVAFRRVAFLGLGVMGYPMAGHLARAGHHVTVYNRTAAKADAWAAEYPGTVAATPHAAAAAADIVFSCVGNDDDLRSIVLGDLGALGAMKTGAIFVDHTTTSAAVARELSAVTAVRGVHFIDAPVSGGPAAAAAGTLAIMAGGDSADVERVQPILAAMGTVHRTGPLGSGHAIKALNNYVAAAAFIASTEAHAGDMYKQVVVDATDEDTIITRSYSGKPMRVFKNDYVADWERRPGDIKPFPMQAMISVQAGVMGGIGGQIEGLNRDRSAFAIGQGSGAIHDILPCAEIVARIMADAEAIITRMAKLRG